MSRSARDINEHVSRPVTQAPATSLPARTFITAGEARERLRSMVGDLGIAGATRSYAPRACLIRASISGANF